MIASELVTLLLTLTLGASAGCAAKEHVIDLRLGFSEDLVLLCLEEPARVVVVDLFSYEGPELTGLSGSACRRCGTGEEGTTCRHLARECRCGTFTAAADIEEAFQTISFDDVEPGNVCVRLVTLSDESGSPGGAGDCTASVACPSPAAPFENTALCLLSQLGTVGVPPADIELNGLACPIADRLLDACADDPCDCPFESVRACLMTPPTADCPPGCDVRVRAGCFVGSRACLLQRSNVLTTTECAGFTGS